MLKIIFSRTSTISLLCLAIIIPLAAFSYFVLIKDKSAPLSNAAIIFPDQTDRADPGLGPNLISSSSPVLKPIPGKASSSIPSVASTSAVGLNQKPAIIPKDSNPVADSPAPALMGKTEVMAWIYPGAPTCNAKREYADGRKIDILKPEYFMVDETGELILLTEKERGCNGYSAANVADIKKYSKEQYVTVSSSYAVSMGLFLTKTLDDATAVETLASFVVDNNLTGIEIDFEDFGGWDASMYEGYKQFVTALGDSLHKNSKKLMIDGPATTDATEEAWYVWRYADFNSLPLDRLVVMTYDYQFDQGVGQAVSPISWIQSTIKWTLSKFPDKKKISFGVPSYGYKGLAGTQKFSLLTYEQIKKEPGFETALRDPASFEMTWRNGENVYFYQDGESLSRKAETIQSSGINSISVWHLGSNLWFTNQ